MRTIILLALLTLLSGCAIDTFEPRLEDEKIVPITDTVYSGCPVDLIHKKYPWRCISCSGDSVNMLWQTTLIDTIK